MLEMTVVGLDGHWETTAPLMHSSFNDGVIQLSPLSSYSVLEIVEISHASFVHLLLQYVPHTVVSWIYFLRIWRPQYRRNEFWISFCLAKTAFFNDVTITSSLRTVVQVLMGHLMIFQLHGLSGWFMPKIMKNCLHLSKVTAKILSVLFFRTRCRSFAQLIAKIAERTSHQWPVKCPLRSIYRPPNRPMERAHSQVMSWHGVSKKRA